MYKQKYYKYKNKCAKLTKGGGLADPNNPDKGDGYDEDNLEYVPDDELDIDSFGEDEINENIDRLLLSRQNFKIDANNEFSETDKEKEIFDVGFFGKARGKSFEYDDFDKEDFTTLNRIDKQKILKISNKETFDDFTNKYGYINKQDKKLYISWDLVNKDYKGIFVESSALSDREDLIPFMNRTASNWVDYDFNYIDDVVIFKKYRNLIHSKEISKPFKGMVTDEYAIDDSEFTRITDPITHDKILLIDDVRSFDKFTTKYGFIKKNEGKDKSHIDIDWNKIKISYDGFYIDKDNDFYNNRYKNAFYKNNLYNSWWSVNKIEAGVVYLFK